MKGLTAALAVSLALLATPAAEAGPLRPHIDSVTPDVIAVGSPDTVIAIEGTGFRAGRAGRIALLPSSVYLSGVRLEAVVLDARHIDAAIPASLLATPESHWVEVRNGPRVGPIEPVYIRSNLYPLAVVGGPPPPPTPVAISIPVERPERDVGCIRVEFFPVDANGDRVSAEGMEFALTSDNLDTPAPSDGALPFYGDYCENVAPIAGPYVPEYPDYPSVWVEAEHRGRYAIEVAALDPPIRGTSNPITVVGGTLSGTVTRASDGSAAAGVEIVAVTEGQLPGLEGDFLHRRFPWSYPNCYGPGATGVVYVFSRNAFMREATAITGPDGTFVTPELPPGSYQIYFRAPATSGLASFWSGGSNEALDAQGVPVRDGVVTSAVDAALSQGGTVSGAVTSAGDPVEGAIVSLVHPATGRQLAATETGADGIYRTPGVVPGSYLVRFDPTTSEDVAQWYDGSASRVGSTPVTVVAGAETNAVGAALSRGAVLSGAIETADAGDPVDATVRVYDAASGTPRAEGRTLSDGSFVTSPGLPPGDYRVEVNSYVRRYPDFWLGGESFANATTLALADGETRHQDLRAEPGAVFSGTVLGLRPIIGLPVIDRIMTPQPVGDVMVEVYEAATGRLMAIDCTEDGSGFYATGGVPAGDYVIRFSPRHGDLAPQWYDGADERRDATVVTVQTGEQRTADATLRPGATISGHVPVSGGDPFVEATVQAWRDGESGPARSTYVFSDDGSYRLTGLVPGIYRISVDGNAVEGGAPRAWYPGVAFRADASPITVVEGEERTGIDVDMPQAAGRIEGRITGITEPGGWADVAFLDPETGERAASTFAERGVYRSPPLHPGAYVVKVRGSWSRPPEYYGDAHSRVGASVVTLLPGAVVTGIDVSLDLGKRILGSARAAHSGAPVPAIGVRVVDSVTGEDLVYGYTWNDGDYMTGALAPGAYKLVFEPGDVYASQWYAGRSSFEEADPVLVGSSAHTTGVDVALAVAP